MRDIPLHDKQSSCDSSVFTTVEINNRAKSIIEKLQLDDVITFFRRN